MPAQQCRAAAWFGQPGGALQFKTAKSVAALVAEGALEADLPATLRAGDVCR